LSPQITQMDTDENPFLFKEETYAIIGACMNVHRNLGHGFLEIVYKDAIELELTRKNYSFDREKQYLITYNGVILPHKFYADFVILDKIILEIKAAERGIGDEQIAQTINYLKASGCWFTGKLWSQQTGVQEIDLLVKCIGYANLFHL
jgi:GxxExxY protein